MVQLGLEIESRFSPPIYFMRKPIIIPWKIKSRKNQLSKINSHNNNFFIEIMMQITLLTSSGKKTAYMFMHIM